MFNHSKSGSIATVFTAILVTFFAAGIAAGQTYTTIANGNWSSAATWQGGSVPPTAANIPAGAIVRIRHTVNYDTGNALRNQGEIRIQPVPGTTAKLNVPGGIFIENWAGGTFVIVNGALVQCRFAPCNDGQPYVGNSPTAQQQTGSFRNLGGIVELRGSNIEIAQSWTNLGGTSFMVDTCITAGESYAIKGSPSAGNPTETIVRSFLSMGWHGAGQFELANGTVTFDRANFQLAGANTNFNLQVGTANGDIDFITLRNHVVPFDGNGIIFAGPGLVTSGINLDAYCTASVLQYQHNQKFTGPQSQNCSIAAFPAICGGGIPTAANGVVQGRVLTATGAGIAKGSIEVVGGNLTQPMRVLTNAFGIFRVDGLEAGQTYIVQVAAKGHTFAEPIRVVTLFDNLTDLEFVADAPGKPTRETKENPKR